MLNFDKVKATDPEVWESIIKEYDRQQNGIELIASENRPSEAVLQAQSSYHTLKYAEGYPKARYYAGCENIDVTEQLAIDRACQLFNCKYANVQPHSGAQANGAVQLAICKAGDTIIGMSLNSGGHLTHGAKPTFSGKHFVSIQYEVNPETYLIDYDEIEHVAIDRMPRLLICGASAYPRTIDFKRFREIVDKVNEEILNDVKDDYNHLSPEKQNEIDGIDYIQKQYEARKCYLMADIAHIAGLVATGLHPSPFPYCDIVTTTTHKTLRGTRGGLILTNDEALAKKIDKAVFPRITRWRVTTYCRS